jgi:SAM-dependent methyltransferase
MRFDKISAAWANYRNGQVATAIHPEDHMMNTSVKLDDYEIVGESGLQVVLSALAISRKQTVYRIMDFGCGHGRVARYLRAAFPKAEMWCSDIDPDAVAFCAKTFNAHGVQSTSNFNDLKLPSGLDLIWVGSVFTHLDMARVEVLFDKLYGALGRGGLLIATFHGQYYYEMTKKDPKKAISHAEVLRQFEEKGHGYMPYAQKTSQVGMNDWGVSATRFDHVFRLGQRHQGAQMAMFAEQAWANFHDVAAWIKQ